MEEAEQSVGFLCQKFTTMMSRLKAVEEERDELLQSSKETEAKVETLVKKLNQHEDCLEAEKKKLENELRSLRTKNEKSESFMTAMKADRDEHEYEMKMIRDKNKQMQEKEALNEKILADAKDQCLSLENERNKLELSSQSLQARTEQLSDQLCTTETETIHLRRQNSSFKQILQAREDESRKFERRYNEEMMAYRSQKDELNRVNRLVSVQASKVADATAMSASMEVQISDLKERLDALRNRNKMLEQEKLTTVKCLEMTQSKERELQSVIQKECHQNKNIRKAINELEMGRDHAMKEADSIRSEYSAEMARSQLLESQSQHWEDKVSSYIRQVEGYKEETKNTQEHLALLQQKNEGLECVNASLRNELKDSWMEKERLINSNKREQQQFEHWKKKAQMMAPDLEQAKAKQTELERRIRHDDEALAIEREKQLKYQRQARVSQEKIKALNRKCEMLISQAQRGGAKDYFEKMLSRENPGSSLRNNQGSYCAPPEETIDCGEEELAFDSGEPIHIGEPFDMRSNGQRSALDGGFMTNMTDSTKKEDPIGFLCKFIQNAEKDFGYPSP